MAKQDSSIVRDFNNGILTSKEALVLLGAAMEVAVAEGASTAFLEGEISKVLGMADEPEAENLDAARAFERSRNQE